MSGGTVALREKWPVLGRDEQAAVWLQVWTDLGRAPRTIDAYARGLAEHLLACERDGVDPVTANRADVAAFVRKLMSRPHRKGRNVIAIDSVAGLATATPSPPVPRQATSPGSTTTSATATAPTPFSNNAHTEWRAPVAISTETVTIVIPG
ncbi:hypothetical protein [Nocardia amamiensis]|uniref:hypothetical protein n=1 Tax=Nocardia amamiensis TaxID=404578 RepID=UPI001E449FA8|nr:hypothetical protein [Nocardia amamiensis]